MEQILMAGHEPEKNEITSPTERLHNDIKDAIKRNQTTKEEKTALTNYLNALQNVIQKIKNVKRSVLKNIRNVK